MRSSIKNDNRNYTITFKKYPESEPQNIIVKARTKWEAYDKAMYEVIPEIMAFSPYSAWVSAVCYKNGNFKKFNTFEGMPY